MTNLIPFTYPEIQIRESHDKRVAHAITSTITEKTKFVIIGFPFDEGVKLNGGFPGARKAPDTIRLQLAKMVANSTFQNGSVADLGNLDVEGKSVEEAQEQLGKVVSEILQKGLIPIILGGGHETSFGHFLGYVGAKKEVEIINLDAHTDVRELVDRKAHSGSPFRQAILHESGLLKSYHVIGAKRNRVAEKHAEFVSQHGSIQYLGESSNVPDISNSVMLTLDCDVFDVSVMPGVSARNSFGMSKREGLELVKEILKSGKVMSVDIVEINPERDLNDQSVSFAAEMVYEIMHFMEAP